MRISSYAVARPAYYDRNATANRQSYNNTVAPHTFTTRWSATVAAGKKAVLDFASAVNITASLATVSGTSQAYITINDGVTYPMVLNATIQTSTTTYVHQVNTSTTIPFFYAGDNIIASSVDLSTGGTRNIQLYAQFTIFDA